MNRNLIARFVSQTVFYQQTRSKIFPTPFQADFIQGKSALGQATLYEPLRLELEKGKTYAYCACGLTKKDLPFCDGSHKNKNAQLNENDDKFGPLRFTSEEHKQVLMCLCRQSSSRPFCDGSCETISIKKK